ncbi:MAG: GNAT family N-acetyltransferase [candidate division WOR-3 bacterium]
MKVDVLTRDSEIYYEEFFDQCRLASIQHSLEWRDVICGLEKDEPFFIIAKENNKIVGALPLYFYKCKHGNLLTSIAWYTISGIICSEDAHKREVYRQLLDYSILLAKELDCNAVSISTNPFLNDEELYLEHLKPDYMLENFIQYIKLREIFNKDGVIVHPNYTRKSELSRNLERAVTQPLIISERQTQEYIDRWYKIHEKRMKELNAEPIPKGLFDGILKCLTPKGKGKFVFAFSRGELVSGGAFIFNKKIMNAYMLSMDSKYKDLRSNYLITYHVLNWANRAGIEIFNWMSSDRRGGGVYKWKEQWGSRELTCLYLTKILGDIRHWRNMDYIELKRNYGFHYLLPFNLLKTPGLKVTTKDDVATFMQDRNEI